MKTKWIVCIWGLVGTLLMGCSKDQQQDFNTTVLDNPTTTEYVLPHDARDSKDAVTRLQETVNSYQLSCEAESCPEGVGALIAIRNEFEMGEGRIDKLIACTAFMIDGYHVVTNRHCISDELKVKDFCKDNVGFVFLKNTPEGRKERVIRCLQVESMSEEKDDLRDFAVLSVSANDIEPLKLSNKGLFNHEPLRLIKVNHLEKLKGGAILSETCTVRHGGFGGHFHHNFSERAVVNGCRPSYGNSGSPLLNAVGQVSGIVFAILKDRAQTEQENGIAFLNNVACIQTPYQKKANPNCKLGKPQMLCERSHDLGEGKKLSHAIYEIDRQLPRHIQFSYNFNFVTSVITAIPQCVREKGIFLYQNKDLMYSDEWFIYLTGGFRKGQMDLVYEVTHVAPFSAPVKVEFKEESPGVFQLERRDAQAVRLTKCKPEQPLSLTIQFSNELVNETFIPSMSLKDYLSFSQPKPYAEHPLCKKHSQGKVSQ